MSVVATSYSLSVEEVPLEKYGEILPITEKWLVVANKKIVAARREDPRIFEASILVIDSIKTMICEVLKTEKLSEKSLFICVDDKFTVHALSFFKKIDCYVSWIASDPKNLVHPVNDLTKRVHGAGTTIICHFAKIAKEKNLTLSLTSMFPADAFYINLGFKQKNPFKMCLSVEKIEELLLSKKHLYKSETK